MKLHSLLLKLIGLGSRIPCPPPDLRPGPWGRVANSAFLKSADEQAERLLAPEWRINPDSRVLDFGCGAGRLAIGIIRNIGSVNYLGIDVRPECIEWCQKEITRRYPSFRFELSTAANERYNPNGTRSDLPPRLPLPDRAVDAIFLHSVFTHMRSADIVNTLREFSRVLTENGYLCLTAFLGDDCSPETENPPNVIAELGVTATPLFYVQYERGYFTSLLADAGFEINRIDPPSHQYAHFVVYATRVGRGRSEIAYGSN